MAIGYAMPRSRAQRYRDPRLRRGWQRNREARIASPIALEIFRELRLAVSVEGIEGKGHWVLKALAQRIGERLRAKQSYTVFERDLSRVWPRDEMEQLRREKQIHAFATTHGWIATILDPGIRVTFREAGRDLLAR